MIASYLSKTKAAFFAWSINLVKRQFNNQYVMQMLPFLVHDCGASKDTYLRPLPAHVAVDHNHKRFDDEFSE